MRKIFSGKCFLSHCKLLPIPFAVFMALPLRADVLNGNFNSGNSGFSTSYTFIPSGTSTTPGTFGIRTNSQDFNPGYNLFGDHTTGSGNMMLVDGAPNSSVIVWQENMSVTTNTTYIWSAWATPANSSNPAQLQFSINGAVVGSTLILNGTPGVWQHFTVQWNSGNATTAALAINDLTTIDLGNDFALDDFSFYNASNLPVNISTAVEINWPSQTGVNYQVQYATTLNSNVWLDLGAPIAGTGTNNSVFDSTRNQPMKFYRVVPAP